MENVVLMYQVVGWLSSVVSAVRYKQKIADLFVQMYLNRNLKSNMVWMIMAIILTSFANYGATSTASVNDVQGTFYGATYSGKCSSQIPMINNIATKSLDD
jgi:hypothetical protein